MKKLLFAIFPVLVISCTGGYRISGTAPQGVDSVTLRILDTAEVVNVTDCVAPDGTFNFSGKLDEISLATIKMDVNGKTTYFVQFAMSNENVTVLLDTTVYGGLSVEGNVTGKKIDGLMRVVFESESDDCPFVIIDSLLTCDSADEIVPRFFNDVSYYINIRQYDTIMAKVDPALKNNMYFVANEAHFECLRRTDVGQPFVDFTCPTADGQPLQLSSIAGKGNWLLVDFWASWCRPCRKENPNVVAAYRKYHEKGFDVLGVSLDKDSTKWADAIANDSLTWTHVSDLKMWETDSRKNYGIRAIPANILIGPDGTIVARDLKGSKLDEFLSETLD